MQNLFRLLKTGTAAVLLITFLVSAQTEQASVTLDKVFSGYYSSRPFGRVVWDSQGKSYYRSEMSKEVNGYNDITVTDALSGEKSVFLSAVKLQEANGGVPVYIEEYTLTGKKDKVLIFTNSERVWRQNTRGDYFLYDFASGKLNKCGKDLPASSMMFAKFSPDEKNIAYVSKNNINTEELATGERKQLTTDGSVTIINGTFDWVYEEEFGLRDGFRWSDDGKKIAFWKLDASGVGEFLMINNTDSIYSYTIPVQYPKAGQTNSACRLGVVEIESGKITMMAEPGDPRNNYIARMEWKPGSEEVVFQYLNRLQNNLKIISWDYASGKTEVIKEEKEQTWIDVNDVFTWLDDEDFLWMSEEDGWRRLYRVSSESGKVTPLFTESFDVIDFNKHDLKGGYAYFYASPGNATQKYLYRCSLKGGKPAERFTSPEIKGMASYNISPDFSLAIESYSMQGVPTVTNLLDFRENKVIRELNNGEAALKKLMEVPNHIPEMFTVKTVSGIEIDGWAIYPPDFDPSKKYPVLFYVYGEPASQTVTDNYQGFYYLFHLALANRGIIVMSLDGRGTPAPKGKEWRKSIYQKIGVISSKDQSEALEQLLKERPYMDATRIGIWGWSGGGAMTLNMLFRYPEQYKVGCAVAPVTDLRYYDTIYEERYMGLPDQSPEAYRECSPVNFAGNLKGRLLLIHGTGDDNVHYQNTERLINELILHNKYFSMLSYPNRSHGIYEGKNTTRHIFTNIYSFMVDELVK